MKSTFKFLGKLFLSFLIVVPFYGHNPIDKNAVIYVGVVFVVLFLGVPKLKTTISIKYFTYVEMAKRYAAQMNSATTLTEYFINRVVLMKYVIKYNKLSPFVSKKAKNRRGAENEPKVRDAVESEDSFFEAALGRIYINGNRAIKAGDFSPLRTLYFQRDDCRVFCEKQGYGRWLNEENLEKIDRIIAEWESYERPANSIEQVDAMEGHAFEYWCADLLRKNGFIEVEVTQGSGDQGVDILAKKDGIKYAVQCKCYSSDLGNTPVQEVHAGKAFYNCQVGAVMTNRHFTKGAKELAQKTGVLLWDRSTLLEMLKESGV